MLKNLILNCAAVTLLGVLAQGQVNPIFCNSDVPCPGLDAVCDTETQTCVCQGATSWKLMSGQTKMFCERFSYSVFDGTTGQWVCPSGLQGSASWGSCCPPLMELVYGACICMHNLVKTNGACGCRASFVIIDDMCSCPEYTSLQPNRESCLPYTYAISAGGGAHTCPKGATGKGAPFNLCMCWGASIQKVSNNVLSCAPYPGARYNATLNRYDCGANQQVVNETCIDSGRG